MDVYLYFLAFGIFVFVFCLGAIIGSFLNVVILRAFSGESIILPPSKCPKCGNKLKWWHNIPIISYFLLKGKCYFCHEHISLQYPIIEFITGCLFVAVFRSYGFMPETIFGFTIASILLVLAVTDIKEKVVFDKHTYFLIIVGLVYNFFVTAILLWNQAFNTIAGFHMTKEWLLYNPLTLSILGLILGVVIMEIAARTGCLIAGKRTFGEGDTYIAAGLGATFGGQNLILILLLSLIIQLVITLPLYVKHQIKKKNYVLVATLSAFIVYAAGLYYILNRTSYLDNFYAIICTMLILLILGIYVCILILKGLKSDEELTVVPFGPALAIAGIIVLITRITLPM